MIKNERQYRITRARIGEFERALMEVSSKEAKSPQDELWLTVQRDAISSQLDELRSQVQEYETLRARGMGALELNSLDELPRILIKARIAAGLSQKEVADRLHLKEQQIQRYESTDFAGVGFDRIKEMMRALGIGLAKGVVLPTSEMTLRKVFERMRSVGLPSEFIQARLLPKELAAKLRAGIATEERANHMWAVEAAGRLSRVFSWPAEAILGQGPLSFSSDVMAEALFKVPARTERQFFAAYTVYAHYLALVLLQCTTRSEAPPGIPTSAAETRKALLAHGQHITLETVLRYTWDHLGISVLPLNDRGAFHAACWRIKDRKVIVLKQRTKSHARWIIDLLHEIRHLAKRGTAKDVSVIEPELLTRDAPPHLIAEEMEATEFAGDVALAGRAEELAKKCVDAAKGKLEWLKSAVPKVAKAEGVPVELLANYMAYRLSFQGENWWGAAQNLQRDFGNPWRVARDFVLARASFEKINPIDKELLLHALSESE